MRNCFKKKKNNFVLVELIERSYALEKKKEKKRLTFSLIIFPVFTNCFKLGKVVKHFSKRKIFIETLF